MLDQFSYLAPIISTSKFLVEAGIELLEGGQRMRNVTKFQEFIDILGEMYECDTCF